MKTKSFFLTIIAGVAISVLASCGKNCTTCTKSGDPYTYEICDNKYKLCNGGTCVEEAILEGTTAEEFKSSLEINGFTCN